MKNNRIVWILGLLAAAFALPASAQWSSGGVYFGGSLGRSTSINACALGPAPCEKKRDTAFNFFAGYDFNRYLGIEAAWNDLGHVKVGGSNIRSTAADLVAVVRLPLTNRFSAYAKGGAYHGDTKRPGVDQRKNGGTFGWGLQYDAGARFAVRGEYQRFMRMAGGSFPDSTNVDLYSIGFLFRF